MPETNRAVAKLKEKFSTSVLDVVEFRGEVTVTVAKQVILDVLNFLKKELAFTQLTDVTAVDYLGKKAERFMVVYQLLAMANKERLRIKTPVSDDDCKIPTSSTVWSTANWLEREVYDLFGIEFENHPDLRRILMTDDWVGHPLRKDYPVQGPGREPYKGRLS